MTVFVIYAARRGHALIDRALYLPRSWVKDRHRCRAAGVPDDVEFATKPALATAMITRALQAGVPVAWVVGDEGLWRGSSSSLSIGLSGALSQP